MLCERGGVRLGAAELATFASRTLRVSRHYGSSRRLSGCKTYLSGSLLARSAYPAEPARSIVPFSDRYGRQLRKRGRPIGELENSFAFFFYMSRALAGGTGTDGMSRNCNTPIGFHVHQLFTTEELAMANASSHGRHRLSLRGII